MMAGLYDGGYSLDSLIPLYFGSSLVNTVASTNTAVMWGNFQFQQI